MESNKRLSEAAALQIIQQCQRLEADFAEQFTAVIQAEGNCQVYKLVNLLNCIFHERAKLICDLKTSLDLRQITYFLTSVYFQLKQSAKNISKTQIL